MAGKKKVSDETLHSLSASRNQYHYQIPCLNLHRKVSHSIDKLFNSVKLVKPAKSYPIPAVKANEISKKVLNGIETSNALVTEKTLFLQARQIVLRNVARMYTRYSSCKTRIDDVKKFLNVESTVSDIVLPKELYSLALFLEKDPDPYFIGDENWYYSNALLVKCIHDTPYMVTSRGTYNNELCLALLYRDEISQDWKVASHQIHSCSSGEDNLKVQPILQVGATKKGFLIERRKSSISVYKLARPSCPDAKHSPSTTPVSTIHADTFPFTSVDIYKREYVVANTERELKVFDLRKSVAKLEGTVPRTPSCTYPNNWNSVAYWRGNPGVVMFADACGVSALDLKDSTLSLLNFWCPRPFLESCERLSFLCQSCYSSDIWYAGTTHHLLGLDTRWTGDRAWVFRVSHQMNAVPMYCTTRCVGARESLVLGDQACNQVRSVLITWKIRSKNSRPFVSPYVSSVHTPLDTLHEARIRGELLSAGLTKRFDNNLLGLSFVPPSSVHPDDHAHSCLTLFSLRSSGDVFVQDMDQESMFKIPVLAKSELVDQENLSQNMMNQSQKSNRSQVNSTMGDESRHLPLNGCERTLNETQMSDGDDAKEMGARLLPESDLRSSETLTGRVTEEEETDLDRMLAAFASQEEAEENDTPAVSQEDLFASPPKATSTQQPYPPSPSSTNRNRPSSPTSLSLTNQNPSLVRSSEVSRSHSESGRSESLSRRELSSLVSWSRELVERTSAREKPLWAGQDLKFVDLFSSARRSTLASQQSLTPAVADTSTLLSDTLADLSLSGLNVDILKRRDPIFESVTNWSDDSSGDEDGSTNRMFADSINRMSQDSMNQMSEDSMNRSSEGGEDERHLESIDEDTMNDLYLESDTDEETAVDSPAVVSQRLREKIQQEERELESELKSSAAGTPDATGRGSRSFPRSSKRVVRQLIPEGRMRTRAARQLRLGRRSTRVPPLLKPLDTPRRPGISAKKLKKTQGEAKE